LLCDVHSSKSVAEAGPFCNTQVMAQHVTDLKLVIELCDELFVNKSVVVFGDSQGAYRRFIHNSDKVRAVDAYDGSPFINASTKNEVSANLIIFISCHPSELRGQLMKLKDGSHCNSCNYITCKRGNAKHSTC
jgi:hypothetical protein